MGRDELCGRLRYACQLLERMDSLETQITRLRRGYRDAPHKKKLPGNLKSVLRGIAVFFVVLVGLAYLGDNLGGGQTSLTMILYSINFKLSGQDVARAEAMTRSMMRVVAGAVVLLAALAALLALFLFIRSNHRSVNRANRKINQENTLGHAAEAANRQRAEELLAQLNGLIQEGRQNVLSWLPQDYYSLEILRFLCKVLEDYRANTFQEAVNLYHQELDKQELRNQFQQMAFTQAQTLESLEAVRRDVEALRRRPQVQYHNHYHY